PPSRSTLSPYTTLFRSPFLALLAVSSGDEAVDAGQPGDQQADHGCGEDQIRPGAEEGAERGRGDDSGALYREVDHAGDRGRGRGDHQCQRNPRPLLVCPAQLVSGVEQSLPFGFRFSLLTLALLLRCGDLVFVLLAGCLALVLPFPPGSAA